MGIESTQTVHRKDAIDKIVDHILMSLRSRIKFEASELSNEELEDKLYEIRDSIFVNYSVVDDDVEIEDTWF